MDDNISGLDREALIALMRAELAEKERALQAAIAEKDRAVFRAMNSGGAARERSEAAAAASRWKWNNWVRRTFPRHYERIAAEIHGAPADDPGLAYLDRLGGRRVSHERLRADEALAEAIAGRRRALRREQQRRRRERQRAGAAESSRGAAPKASRQRRR